MTTVKFNFKKILPNETFEDALKRQAKEQGIIITQMPKDVRELFLPPKK